MKRAVVIMLVLLFAQPLHAMMFTITDGSYDPIFGPSQTVNGVIDLDAGDDIFGSFDVSIATFYIKGFDQFRVLLEETYFPSDDRVGLARYGAEVYEGGFAYQGSGTVFFVESIRIDEEHVKALAYDYLYLTVDVIYDPFSPSSIVLGTFDILASAAPVPEPTTALLFGTGLIGLAAVGRRRKN
jgi:hypothetical protein